MATVCPVCKKSDKIQKIAAIREAGISRGSYTGPSTGLAIIGGKVGVTGSVTNLSGTSITRLAEGFPPPPYPQMRKGSIGPGTVGVALATLVLSSLVCSSDANAAFVFALIGMIAMLVIAAREQRKTQGKRQRQFDSELRAWKKQDAAYGRIFYCSRDHICFDPKTHKRTKSANATKLIYG